MGRGIYSDIRCPTVAHSTFIPLQHQLDALEYFLRSPYKGLLLYWKLGSGKSCEAILIADSMLKKKMINRVYVLTPGALREGWINEYCKICGSDATTLEKYFTFITYNYMVKELPNLDGGLVIIDEIHNLINGAKNMSKYPTIIYNTILNSNCRVLALSGTPIYNYVYEFALLGRLLKPGDEFPEIRKKGGTIDEQAFMKLFSVDGFGNLTPKNLTSLKRRLEGLVSFYPGAGLEYMPEIIEMEPIKVKMSITQETYYWEKFIQESILDHPPDKSLLYTDPSTYDLLRKLYVMARKKILTRSVSNFYYPSDAIKRRDIPGPYIIGTEKLVLTPLKEAELEVKLEEDEKKKSPGDSPGWVNKKNFSEGQLKIYSPKLTAFLINLVAHNLQKHVLFTFFKTKAGAYLIKSVLDICGISAEIFSGDLDDSKRRSLLKKFNSEENRYGKLIKVLIITEAGVEGVSLLETRHMHIFESSPRMNKTVQAIGRIARFKSHTNLPLEERTVKIWRYWSVSSSSKPVTIKTTLINTDGKEEAVTKVITDKRSVDQKLYSQGMQTIRKINSFLDILKEVSVTK